MTSGGQEAVLRVTDAAGEMRRVPLRDGPLTVGRSSSADLTLSGDGLSRRHVELSRGPGGGWRVRDLGSRNGTFIDGQRIEEAELTPGAAVRIAEYELVVEDEAGRRASAGGRAAVDDDAAMTIQTLGQVEPPRVDTAQLFALQSFSRELLRVADAEQRAGMLCELMTGQALGGRRALVLRLGAEAGAQPGVVHEVAADASQDGPIHLSRTVLEALRGGGEPVLGTNVAPEGQSGAVELSISATVDPMAVIACPLRKDEASGVAEAVYVVLPPERGNGEWLALAALAAEEWSNVEAAWAARRQAEAAARFEQDLERARQVQLGLLPKTLDIAPPLDIATYFEACLGVGGDYLDVLKTQDGRVVLTVADVCGKGIQAAMIAASLRTFVHAAAGTDTGLDVLMRRLHEYLCEALPMWSFVTMVVAAIEPGTGRVEVVNAGHPPLLKLGAGGEVSQVGGATQAPLGVDLEEVVVQRLELEPGELLAMYSDGLTEIMTEGDAWLGVEGLGELLRASQERADEPCERVVQRLAGRLKEAQRGNPADDDQTFLVCRRR